MRDELPEGWTNAALGELTKPTRPRRNPEEHPHLPFVGMEQVESHTRRLLRAVSSSAMKSTAFHFHPGDVLYGRLRPYLNKVLRADFEGLCSSEFIVLPPTGRFEPDYLALYLSTDGFVTFANQLNQGDRPRVSFAQIAEHEIPLAPLAEQKRIVGKLEKLLAKVNAARERLSGVPAILKRFRQAVLAAACSGWLTADWREQHGDIEPGGRLLERIRQSHAKQSKSRRPGKTNMVGQPSEDRDRASELPRGNHKIADQHFDLPETWGCALTGELTVLITKGSSPKWQGFDYCGQGAIFLRSQNVRWGLLDLSEVAHLPEEFNETHPNSIIRKGDVLLNLVGASVGRCALASAEIDGANANQAVGIIRLITGGVLNKFLMLYFLSPYGQGHITQEKADVARANFNLDDISATPVPVPPAEEQNEIVRRVQGLFKLADAIATRVAAATARVEKVTEAILAKAFRGELVPTEAELARHEGRTYEPAFAILARVQIPEAAKMRTESSSSKPNTPSSQEKV